MSSWTLALVFGLAGAAALLMRPLPKGIGFGLFIFAAMNVFIGASASNGDMNALQIFAVGATIAALLLFGLVRWYQALRNGNGPPISGSF